MHHDCLYCNRFTKHCIYDSVPPIKKLHMDKNKLSLGDFCLHCEHSLTVKCPTLCSYVLQHKPALLVFSSPCCILHFVPPLSEIKWKYLVGTIMGLFITFCHNVRLLLWSFCLACVKAEVSALMGNRCRAKWKKALCSWLSNVPLKTWMSWDWTLVCEVCLLISWIQKCLKITFTYT